MIRTLGIDLDKNLCSVAGLDASGAIVVRRRVRRDRVLAFTAGVGPCVVALEACWGPITWPGACPPRDTRFG